MLKREIPETKSGGKVDVLCMLRSNTSFDDLDFQEDFV